MIRQIFQPFASGLIVRCILLDEQTAPPPSQRGNARRAGPGKRVEHEGIRPRVGFNERDKAVHGLLRWVEPIAGIFPRQDICGRIFRGWGISLCQQVSCFVPHLVVSDARGIVLDPNEMPDGMKAAFPPDGKETVGLAPAVEADAIGVGLEHAEYLPKGREHPARVIVVGNGLAAPGHVFYKVRRVS